MASIMYRDPEHEASFSFSCYDFNSALQVFSDDEGGVNDDEYIEIELEQPGTTYADDDDDRSRDEELELRISFSSSVPFLETPNHHNIGLSRTSTVESLGNDESEVATTPSSSSSSSTRSCSSGETCWAAATTEPASRARTHKTVKRRVQFRAANLNRLVNNFIPTTPKPSSAIVEKDRSLDESRQIAIQTNNQLELVSSRKATKMTKSTNNGTVMKFLVKCRSITIRALLASFVKPYQIIIYPQSNSSNSGQKKKKRSKETLRAYQSLVKPFDKWLVQRDQKANINGERSKVFDINMDAIKGVLSLGCKDKKTSSSPSCTNYSFPIQQGHARDNSIQAAIAHCKRSFGQASEFPFSS